MNRSTILFIAFLAIAMYISTIAFFVIKVFSYSEQGREAVIDQCTDLTQKTFDYVEAYKGINVDFSKNYIPQLDRIANIAAVLLEDTNNHYFTYPKNSSLFIPGETIIKTQSPFISVFSSTMLFENNPIQLTFALYHISPNTIHDLAKKCFFLLFATTLFVLLSIIINKILQKEQYEPAYDLDYDEKPNKKEKNTKTLDEWNDLKDDFSLESLDLDFKTDDFKLDKDEPIISQNIDFEKKEEVPQFSQGVHVKEPIQNEAKKIEPKKIQFQGKTISDPLGLFSPITGFGWESYLETRLDSELIRASSSEQDLSLILVKIQGLEHYPAYIEYITNALLDIFKYRDLIFEYGQEAFACIYQDLNVENSLNLAEELYLYLKEIFKNCDVKLGIGISTRSLRIIPGTRILQEAEQALEKALTEKENPIIAFKANPDKYKDFVYDTL